MTAPSMLATAQVSHSIEYSSGTGPKSGHKLTGEVVSHLEELLAADPRLRPADLAAAAGQRFGVSVHPRSVERALQRRRKARSAAGQAGQQAPKS
jgi:hypothetical protein